MKKSNYWKGFVSGLLMTVLLLAMCLFLPSVLAITLGSSFAAAGDWRATAIVFSVTAAAVVIGALAYHRFKRQRDGGAGGAAK